MKILITGAAGLIGSALTKELKTTGHTVIPYSKKELDVTSNRDCYKILNAEPDWVIHCASLISVDAAEAAPELANKINVEGTANVVEVCQDLDIPMFYYSSCAVFDGQKRSPYKPEDPVNPLSAYSRTKVDAENVVKTLNNSIILRCTYVYGDRLNSFVTSAVQKLKNESCPDFPVVDQILNIVDVGSVCAVTQFLLGLSRPGVYHFGTRGECTRKEIVEFIAQCLGKTDFTFSQYNQAARNPYAILDLTETERILGEEIPDWTIKLKSFTCEEQYE